MRSVQEENLAKFFKELRRGGTYNRKWWNPLEFSMYINDLIRHEEIPSVIEVGTGNGVTASWAALGGAFVWTCDQVDRPKVWDADIFPFPDLASRIQYFVMEGDSFLKHQTTRTSNVCRDIIVLDGPTSEKGFRRLWATMTPKKDDIIVAPIGHPEIYQCFLKLREADFDVKYNTSTESYTVKWPEDGAFRDW